MALQVDLPVTPIGVSFASCYARVADFRGDKSKITARIEVHTSADARAGMAAPILSQEFEIPLIDLRGPLLPAIYEWLKRQPAFVDASDC